MVTAVAKTKTLLSLLGIEPRFFRQESSHYIDCAIGEFMYVRLCVRMFRL
jgi:hypothetical protein